MARETAQFQITEYEQVGNPPTLRFLYQSAAMRFRDASRFAAALSYAMGAYVSVIASEPNEEAYYEWWFAGALWQVGLVPRERLENSGLTEVPQRELVEESAEMAEDKRRRSVEKSKRFASASR
jgi:hypothetical protein